jgi:sec-independent protein translocase protein TatA
VPNIGPTELIIVLVIVLLIFGPKRLPGLGRQLGSGMREFKDSITGKSDDRDDDEPGEGTKRRDTEAALGRPDGEQAPLEGEVVSERRS